MTNEGKVLSISGDHAEVEVIRNTACAMMHEDDACKSCEGCEGCSSEMRRMTVNACNDCGARPGDVVELYSSSRGVLLLSCLVFVVPVNVFVCIYLLLATRLGELYSILAGAAGFCLCFVLLRIFDRRLAASSKCHMTRVIAAGESGHSN